MCNCIQNLFVALKRNLIECDFSFILFYSINFCFDLVKLSNRLSTNFRAHVKYSRAISY